MRNVFKHILAFVISILPISGMAVNLTVDTDRDTILDPQKDEAGEEQWTWQRGAVVLNNNDSDQDTGEPDHADSIVNGPDDLLDFAQIQISGLGDRSTGAMLALNVSSEDVPFVQIFQEKSPGVYQLVTENSSANIQLSDDIEDSLSVYLEANSYATGSWDGLIDLEVALQDGNLELSDSVQLRVAPWLMLSNFQKADRVYLREYLNRNDVMKGQLTSLLPGVNASLVVSPHSAPYPNNNIWMQDAMEIGYSEVPGRSMSVVLRSNRGPSWPLSDYPKDEMLGPDFGWIKVGNYRSTQGGGSSPDGWLDWFGNLEVTPPIQGHPYGRIYYGYNPATGNSLNPEQVAFLNAQELQGPALALDTGWLLIQHVDEIVAWVPSNDGKGKILVPDTRVMYDLLDQWVGDGLSSEPMMRRYNNTETVGAFRNATSFRNNNINLQTTRIDPVIEQMKSEWGLTEDDVIRVPSAYYSNGGAYVPSMVNALVLNGAIYVSDPHGPEPEGVDLMQQYFEEILEEAGVELDVHYLDDWRYHTWSGNVHCATNARREGFSPSIWSYQGSPMWLIY